MTFESETHGHLSQERVLKRILDALQDKYAKYHVWVGSDSQNHKRFTKMVLVVCLYQEGKGASYFYNIQYLPKIRVLDEKIYTETETSLAFTRELNEFLFKNGVRAQIEIHCDIGPNGPTKKLIQPIVGWITAEGFIPKYKYESTVASTVADRISK